MPRTSPPCSSVRTARACLMCQNVKPRRTSELAFGNPLPKSRRSDTCFPGKWHHSSVARRTRDTICASTAMGASCSESSASVASRRVSLPSPAPGHRGSPCCACSSISAVRSKISCVLARVESGSAEGEQDPRSRSRARRRRVPKNRGIGAAMTGGAGAPHMLYPSAPPKAGSAPRAPAERARSAPARTPDRRARGSAAKASHPPPRFSPGRASDAGASARPRRGALTNDASAGGGDAGRPRARRPRPTPREGWFEGGGCRGGSGGASHPPSAARRGGGGGGTRDRRRGGRPRPVPLGTRRRRRARFPASAGGGSRRGTPCARLSAVRERVASAVGAVGGACALATEPVTAAPSRTLRSERSPWKNGRARLGSTTGARRQRAAANSAAADGPRGPACRGSWASGWRGERQGLRLGLLRVPPAGFRGGRGRPRGRRLDARGRESLRRARRRRRRPAASRPRRLDAPVSSAFSSRNALASRASPNRTSPNRRLLYAPARAPAIARRRRGAERGDRKRRGGVDVAPERPLPPPFFLSFRRPSFSSSPPRPRRPSSTARGASSHARRAGPRPAPRPPPPPVTRRTTRETEARPRVAPNAATPGAAAVPAARRPRSAPLTTAPSRAAGRRAAGGIRRRRAARPAGCSRRPRT